ncbi:protein of unknown function [Thermococcus camini]|uniref:Uncharacterized protein n=1 Tax=Thermococcus camini TaxID=2016373 RepID=A0A7G2D7U7_9EURY|nr:protein of unknown function [Thermococcus camini]
MNGNYRAGIKIVLAVITLEATRAEHPRIKFKFCMQNRKCPRETAGDERLGER